MRNVHAAVWSWREPVHGEHFHRCTFCGGISPDDLATEPVTKVDWADQKYGWPHKFYVDIENRTPDRLYCIGALYNPKAHDCIADDNLGCPACESQVGYIPYEDLTGEQREIIRSDGFSMNDKTSYRFGTRSTHHAKFYTTHLDDDSVSLLTKVRVAQICGLQFIFSGGTVAWQDYRE